MAKVAAIAKLTAQPGKRDELIAVLRDLATSVDDEPGTLVYAVHADKADGDVVWFYELYEDDAALAAHAGSPAMKEAGPRFASLLAGRPDLTLLEPLRAKGLDF